MKTESKKNIELAQRLLNTINLRKEIEAEEAELKAEVKSIMGDNLILEAGNIVIVVDERTRTDLDKKSLITELGKDIIAQFEKMTTFKVMTVRAKGE